MESAGASWEGRFQAEGGSPTILFDRYLSLPAPCVHLILTVTKGMQCKDFHGKCRNYNIPYKALLQHLHLIAASCMNELNSVH